MCTLSELVFFAGDTKFACFLYTQTLVNQALCVPAHVKGMCECTLYVYLEYMVCCSWSRLSQVRALHGIPALVQLFSSDNQEVLRFATGATRNLIYENADNKVVLIDAGGVMHLISILSEPDEDLRKTITGNDFGFKLLEILDISQSAIQSHNAWWCYWFVFVYSIYHLCELLSYSDNTLKTCCGCRYPMEPVLQRQPEGETVQRSFIRADRESTDPSVPQHPTVPFWERDLLQHHWLPQVTPPNTLLNL